MISKNQGKFIRSLSMKKIRDENGCFLAEGNKLVEDLLPYFEPVLILAKPSWIENCSLFFPSSLLHEASKSELEKISLLKTPQDVLAVFKKPVYSLNVEEIRDKLSLGLDGIQDPGNLGTILRIADWFGIEHILCSKDTADVFNPKTVQATMGAIARVKVHYTDLCGFLSEHKGLPIIGTFLNGENIYTADLPSEGIVIMGNEGNGISRETAKYITHRIFIPSYPEGKKTSESLNVATAAAITCAEFRRQEICR